MLYHNIIVFILCHLFQDLLAYQVKDAPLLTKRPPWLLPCRKSDPELNTCLNNLFTALFPELAKGIPEMNIDPFEPLPLDKVTISKGVGPITLTGSLYNLIVAGSSNATPTYTIFDLDKRKWKFGLSLPLLTIKSQYNLKGKILVLPLVGHGACDMRLFNVDTKVSTNIDIESRENRDILKIVDIDVDFEVGGMKVKFHNLFNGNKVLGHTVNQFLNQHAIDVISELKDSIGESLAEIFTAITNNIYVKMPIDLWLLSDEEYEKYLKEKNVK